MIAAQTGRVVTPDAAARKIIERPGIAVGADEPHRRPLHRTATSALDRPGPRRHPPPAPTLAGQSSARQMTWSRPIRGPQCPQADGSITGSAPDLPTSTPELRRRCTRRTPPTVRPDSPVPGGRSSARRQTTGKTPVHRQLTAMSQRGTPLALLVVQQQGEHRLAVTGGISPGGSSGRGLLA